MAALNVQASAELNDFSARIQYAYYTEDRVALKKSLEELAKTSLRGADASLKQEYLAYGEWKSAELARANDKADAAEAADRCVAATESALDGGATPAKIKAELYSLQAICATTLGELRSFRAPLYKRKADKSFSEALQLDARNPRVLMVRALARGQENSSQTSDTARSQWLDVVQAFTNDAPGIDNPDWGFPEALAALGAVESARGDAVAARDALERALVLAPDYHFAQTLLRKIAVR